MHIKAIFYLFLVFSPGLKTFASNGDEIMSRVDLHEQGYVDLKASITMQINNNKGKKTTRSLDIYSLETGLLGEKRKFVFRAPADVNGTTILIHSLVTSDDQQWIYLPAFKRIKRISSANKTSPFMGSHFTYEDLSSQEKEKYRNEYLRTVSINDSLCDVVKRTPLFPNSGYDHLLVYVDKARHRPLKVEYFDKKGRKTKTLFIAKYKLYKQRFLLASDYRMEDHSNNASTNMKWQNIQLQNNFLPTDFNKKALLRAK